jgi:hypothetical protein
MELSDLNRKIVSSFVNAFIKLSNAKSSLLLEHGDFNIFNDLETIQQDTFNRANKPFPNLGSWDIVLGDFPFGMSVANTPLAEYGLPTYSTAATIKSLPYLSSNGYGIYVIEPSSLAKSNFRAQIKSNGFSIAAILNAPEGLLKAYTALRFVFIVLKKGKVDKEFIGELESVEQAHVLVENYFSSQAEQNLSMGIWLDSGKFDSFNKWKIQQQISALDSEYKKFTKRKLSDVATSINACKVGATFEYIENSIYIPKIGTQPVISDINKTAIKHQNYFQVVCNSHFVEAEYLEAFFGSKLGRLIIESLPSQSWIPSINKADISDAEIALPNIPSQKEIVASIKKLRQIKEKISSFEDNLALNPISSEHALKQIDSMLEVVGELAMADKIKSIIRAGESKNIEFKETLSLNVFTNLKDKKMEDAVIKTVAAFFNTDGGVLLVGVHDSGQITGLDIEIEQHYENKDKFLLHFKNLLKNRIGEQFYPFIEHNLISVDSKLVLFINCLASTTEVFVDEKDFYVRTNPATDKLEGIKQSTYIKHHFHH